MGKMSEDFKKDFQALLAKHGLKADDDAIEEVAEEAGDQEQGKQNTESKVTADIAERVAEKLANIIIEKKGITAAGDKEDLSKTVKSKIWTKWSGMQEIEYPTDLKSLSKEEKIVTFFKALVFARGDQNSQNVLRALVEGTDSEGGYLVPQELRTEVFRVLPDQTIMRNLARVLPMTNDLLKINNLSARPTAYWVSEYQSSSTTSAEFGEITLTPNDLVCLLPISQQLLADANINLVDFIVTLFAEAIGLAEDQAFFTGSGSGQPKGINQESISSKVYSGGKFDDILDLIDLVPQRVVMSPKAAFVGHRNLKRLLRKIKDNNGDYIWRDGKGGVGGSGESIRLPDTLYGYPFYEENFLNQKELYFGDWSMYVIGDRQTMAVQTTTEGGDAWRRNSLEIKAVERVDGKAIITSPFAKLTNVN